MMSLFSSPFYATPAETSFTPLFRLLDDFESYQQELQSAQQQQQPRPQNNTKVTQQRQQQQRRAAAAPLPTFRPRFDVRETDNTYELHGELAGLDRENVEIEFTDPQTMVIRGRVERTYENKPEQKTETAATTTETVTEEKKRRNSHQATVEDDPEEPSTPVQHTPPESPRAQPADKQVQKAQQPKAPAAPEPKYWAFERSIGEFSRSFSFPTRVEHDGVAATLENGILTVTVPKAKKHEVRRIAIL